MIDIRWLNNIATHNWAVEMRKFLICTQRAETTNHAIEWKWEKFLRRLDLIYHLYHLTRLCTIRKQQNPKNHRNMAEFRISIHFHISTHSPLHFNGRAWKEINHFMMFLLSLRNVSICSSYRNFGSVFCQVKKICTCKSNNFATQKTKRNLNKPQATPKKSRQDMFSPLFFTSTHSITEKENSQRSNRTFFINDWGRARTYKKRGKKQKREQEIMESWITKLIVLRTIENTY